MEAGRATVNLEGTPTNIKWWNRGCGQIFRLFGKVSAILVSITMTIMYDNHTTMQLNPGRNILVWMAMLMVLVSVALPLIINLMVSI